KNVEIKTEKDAYCAGETVKGTLKVAKKLHSNARNIEFYAHGNEHVDITESQTHYDYRGRPYTTWVTYSENRSILSENFSRLVFDGGFDSGDFTEIPFEFKIPEDALETFSGNNASVRYGVHLKADMPWKTDVNEELSLNVLSKRGIDNDMNPVAAESRASDARVRLELGDYIIYKGGVVNGKLFVKNDGEKKLRKAEIILRGIEDARAQGRERTSTIQEYKINVDFSDGNNEFSFELPKDAQRSYRGTYSSYSWEI
ncbi:MAG: hypothetical protein HZB68_00720, partial [Candidatus Aenigmarchaeota archaeon]|nr:hypothetical protein [Candidatus Aenigmarchaeota archaeon]